MKNNIFIFDDKISKNISFKDFFNGKLNDGIFSLKKKISKNKTFIARDAYGVKKIFYCFKKKNFFVADNFIDLKRKTKNQEIFSLPPGKILIYDKKKNNRVFKNIKYKKKNEKINLNIFKKKILFFFKMLKKHYNEKCIILLSGGLDSTIIAYLAKQVFKEPIAVSATLLGKKDFNIYQKEKTIKYSNYPDLFKAQQIAKELNVKFLPVISSKKSIIKNLSKIMYSIQDWRDFNVHCGCLNYEIAKYLKRKNLVNIPIFTGDFMNEIFADYTSETFEKKEYYKQLNVSTFIRSKWLVKGLETSDRENGIFNNFNLPLYQPYFRVIDLFKNLDKSFFKKFNKYNFNGKILPKRILRLVSKKKNRAQITDKEGGILGFFIKNNITEEQLFKNFKKKFKFNSLWLKQFIVFGRYRVEDFNR